MTHIAEWRVRETTLTTGQSDLVLAGPMYGSLPFLNAAVMAIGDTCDYVVHYDNVFESGLGTMAAGGTYGTLQRTTIYRSKHANGDINTLKVTLPAGTKTVIMSIRANKIARGDIIQAFTAPEKAQHRANAPPFETGTRLIFQQTTAPVGWTKDVASHNDKALRFTTGTVGSGGTVDFSTAFSRTATDGTAISVAQMPSHDHGGGTGSANADHTHAFTASVSTEQVQSGTGATVASDPTTSNTGGQSGSHQHSISAQGSGQSHTHPMDIRVKYADAIIAVAN